MKRLIIILLAGLFVIPAWSQTRKKINLRDFEKTALDSLMNVPGSRLTDSAKDTIRGIVSDSILTINKDTMRTVVSDSVNDLRKRVNGYSSDDFGTFGFRGLYDFVKREIDKSIDEYKKERTNTDNWFYGLDSIYSEGSRLFVRFNNRRYALYEEPESINQYSLAFRSANSETAYINDADNIDIDRDYVVFIRFSCQVDSTGQELILAKQQSSANEWVIAKNTNQSITVSIEKFLETTSVFTTSAGSISLNDYYGKSTWHSLIFVMDTSNANRCKIYWDGDSLELSTRTLGNGVDYSNSGNMKIARDANDNIDVSKLAIWKGKNLADRWNDNIAKYLHNYGYDYVDFNDASGAYPKIFVDSLRAYWNFNEGSGQYVYSQVSTDTLFLGTTSGSEAADPTWQEYSPDNPQIATPDTTESLWIDDNSDASTWKMEAFINIVPMRSNDTTAGEIYFSQRRAVPRVVVFDDNMPNDTLFCTFLNHVDGGLNNNYVNTHGLYRSYDGGFTWDSLRITHVNNRQLSLGEDSLKAVHPDLIITPDDTLILIFPTIKRTGSGSGDYEYSATYLVKSGDYGSTWSDTVRVTDSTFYSYCKPSAIWETDSTVHIIGGTINDGACVMHYNWKTNTVDSFNFIFSYPSTQESSWLLYDTTNTRAIATNRTTSSNWWVGHTDDYGVTWRDSITIKQSQTLNQPSLIMLKNKAGVDSVVAMSRINYVEVFDSVQKAIRDGDSLSINKTQFPMIWASQNTNTPRYSPIDLSAVNLTVGKGPSFVHLDENRIGYTLMLGSSSISEPYFVRAKRVITNPSDRLYKAPQNNGYVKLANNYDQSNVYRIPWAFSTTSQSVKILYPPAGVTGEVVTNNYIDFSLGHYAKTEGQVIIFEVE